MKTKKESYYAKVLKKLVYLCVLLLDPSSKDQELTDETLALAGIAHCENWKTHFLNECRKLHQDSSSVTPEDPIPPPKDQPRSFVTKNKAQGIEAELQTYPSTERENRDCNPLIYWGQEGH